MDTDEKPTGETADEGESPVVELQDSEGLAAECVVADSRWLEVFDNAFQLRATAAIRSCLATAGRGPAELAVLLTGNDAVADLNAAHRGRSGPTNILSFPGDGAGGGAAGTTPHLGDLAMAWGVVRDEAKGLGIEIGDHALHLLVHGTLHLLGHDHANDEEAVLMERTETAILADFGVADPHRAQGGAGR